LTDKDKPQPPAHNPPRTPTYDVSITPTPAVYIEHVTVINTNRGMFLSFAALASVDEKGVLKPVPVFTAAMQPAAVHDLMTMMAAGLQAQKFFPAAAAATPPPA
jgi:hypothetical protein